MVVVVGVVDVVLGHVDVFVDDVVVVRVKKEERRGDMQKEQRNKKTFVRDTQNENGWCECVGRKGGGKIIWDGGVRERARARNIFIVTKKKATKEAEAEGEEKEENEKEEEKTRYT
jgi:hypothetical protein